jgi:arsenical pump membrane protein
VAALVVVLGCAVWRPRGLPEAVVAVPAALLVIATGAISAHDALEQARRLGPVIGFLAAVLVLAQLCDDDGLFRACGAWLARAAAGRPQRLLALVFAVAAVTTAVLSLDATVVLLTPVVFATAARLEARARPHLYACTHLSNSGSLLLPVSNLTNLLAFAASGLSFGRFAGLMALPWLGVIGTEYVVFRRFFAADLAAGAREAAPHAMGHSPSRTAARRRSRCSRWRWWPPRSPASSSRRRRASTRPGPRWPAWSCSARGLSRNAAPASPRWRGRRTRRSCCSCSASGSWSRR